MAVTVYIQYRVTHIEARIDGSGWLNHDLWGEKSLDGENWSGDLHFTLTGPGAEAKVIIDAGGGSVKANYKTYLQENWATSLPPQVSPPMMPSSGGSQEIAEYYAAKEAYEATRDAANAVAAVAAATVNEFVPSFPVTFSGGSVEID